MKEVEPQKGLSDAAEAQASAFSDDDVSQITVITLMRIYDMLGAILTHLDEASADAVLEKHTQGGLAGPLPYLNLPVDDEA